MLPPTEGPGESFSIRELRGRHIIDKFGNNVGTVDDIALDSKGWRVSGLVVTVHRNLAQRLRMRTGFLDQPRIQLGSERIASVGDNILLNIDTQEIVRMLGEQRAQPEETRWRSAEELDRERFGRTATPTPERGAVAVPETLNTVDREPPVSHGPPGYDMPRY